MIKLFSPAEFKDYLEIHEPEEFVRNGDMVLSPESCIITANKDGTWTLELTHPIDEYGKHTFIRKESVLAVPGRIAREQVNDEQYYRIYDIEIDDNKIIAKASPIIYESANEVPFNQVSYEELTPAQLIEKYKERYPDKYDIQIDDDIASITDKVSVYLENTNLQEVINGNQDAAIRNLVTNLGYECGMVYDWYIDTRDNKEVFRHVYRLGSVGDFEGRLDRKIEYGYNITGITITENTSELITRVYPVSDEGYTLGTDERYINDSEHRDADNIADHPIAYAKSIKYSDVKLVDLLSDSDKSSMTGTLSDKWWYGTKDKDGKAKYYPKSQYLYSYEYGKWYWFDGDGWMSTDPIPQEKLDELNRYYWHLGEHGWWYGDDNGHFIANGWVEDEDRKHYWMDDHGYSDRYTYVEGWQWYEVRETVYTETDTQQATREAMAVVQSKAEELSRKYLKKAHNGEWDHKKGSAKRWWYGTKTEEGTAALYAAKQYIFSYRDNNWYWFDDKGWYVDGSEIDAPTISLLNSYTWRQDNVGWYYGDGNGNYMTSAWIEDEDGGHRWVDQDGYLDETKNNLEPWNWYEEGEDLTPYFNPHDPTVEYNEKEDRIHLPYGYIFYSYSDAIATLCAKSMEELILDTNEYNYFADAIKAGFKWCETTEIAAWDWRYKPIYNDDEFKWCQDYHWIETPDGWIFADGAGHYFTNGWVEDANDTHYWVNEDGFYDPTETNKDAWKWYNDSNGWWYGIKDVDGQALYYAKSQYMYDTFYKNWYKFDEDGYLVEPDDKRYWYGTKDAEDYVFFRYHKIGNHIYWFDAAGYIQQELYWADDYDLRTDNNGDYYGDGEGHFLKNCWVEISDSKHIWVGEDGYRQELKDDTEEWTWHGSWENGWWYGSDEDEEEDEESDEETCLKSINTIINSSSYSQETMAEKILEKTDAFEGASNYVNRCASIANSQSSYSSKDAFVAAIRTVLDDSPYDFDDDSESDEAVCKKIYSVISSSASYGKFETASKVLEKIPSDKEYTSGSYIGRIKTICNNAENYTKNGLVDAINSILEETPYTYETDSSDDEEEGSSTDANDPTTAKNYVNAQFMYVGTNSSWYYFGADGFATAVWMTDADWEWEKDSVGWWYGDSKGNYPAGQWMKIDGKWYFFDANGYADESTDDFAEESKTGDDNSATYDNNLDGIGTGSSTTTSDDSSSSYDDSREGVRAWIQDEFISEMKECIKEQHLNLLNVMRTQLENCAYNTLSQYQNPSVTVEVDFDTLSQVYPDFQYLNNYYLGDYVEIIDTLHDIESVQRVTEIEYDCIAQRPIKITVGEALQTWVTRDIDKIITTGTIMAYTPESGLEDGEGNYLTTGYSNTNLGV